MLLTTAATLIPFLGGNLANDAEGLESGYVATMRSLFRGSEIATLQHALLALLVIGAFVFLVVKRKIVQVPNVRISAPLAALFALLLGSVFMANYHWISQTALAEWSVYFVALVVAVAGLGRRNGPMGVIVGLAASSGIVGLLGILEYSSMRSIDPTWRIFAGWNNPNALAGMMLIGFFLNLGLVTRQSLPIVKESSANPQIGIVLAGAGVVCTGIALVLTGSKGGLYTLLPVLGIFVALSVGWSAKPARKALLPAGACVLILAIAAVGIGAASHGGGLRSLKASSTQEQSSGFRLQLWKGAIALVKDNPVGHGLGSYANLSAQPGTNTRTELAHSTWLQLAVEGGFLAPVALAGLLICWLALTFRSAKSLPVEQNILRACVVAAVMATAADGLIESNLYFFGIGLAFFLLLGVGIQLSADGGAPEFVAAPMRIGAVGIAVLCLGQLFFAGFVSKLQANLRWSIANQQFEDARSSAESLKGLSPFDAETWYRVSQLEPSPEARMRDLNAAAEIVPIPKYMRRLATELAAQHRLDDAESALRRGLHLDPNNLATLFLLVQIQDQLGKKQDARETAKQLLAVEATPYFKTRSIPEIVPTETYEVRLYLAQTEPNNAELLKQATEGFLLYAQATVPYARQMDAVGSGVTMKDATEKMAIALKAAKELETICKAKGDEAGAKWAADAATKFQEAIQEPPPKQ